MIVTDRQALRFQQNLIPQPSGCLLWGLAVDRDGYGKVKVGSTKDGSRSDELAHRVAYYLRHGELPCLLRHSCDTPACCNPDHLIPGTHSQNVNDKMERGRWRGGNQAGSSNGNSALTEQQVCEIKQKILSGVTNKEIALCYGIHHSTVSAIRREKIWAYTK